MIGWNVAQNPTGGTAFTWNATGTGITVDYTATGISGDVRVIIQSGGKDYCAKVTTSGTSLPWNQFSVACWDGGGEAFAAGGAITAIALQANSTASLQTFTNFCLDGVTPY
jgi:hypothetical protein